MRLPDYIRQIGPKRFAELYGVTERAAIAYQYRTRLPRVETARKVVAESPVTWEGIYGADPEPPSRQVRSRCARASRHS